MRRILVALFGLLICGSAFACTVYKYEIVNEDIGKGLVEMKKVPVYIGPGSCDMPGGKVGGFENPKPTATDIRNKYTEIQHRKHMKMQTGAQERELAEMLAK